MSKFFYIITSLIIACIFTSLPLDAKGIKEVKQERKNAQKEINETSRKIKLNARQIERQLNECNLITAEIEENKKAIEKIKAELNNIEKQISKINDTIKVYDNQLSMMRENYIKIIKKMRSKRANLNKMFFIFSSNSFRQAARRIRYLKQFTRWRKKQSSEIKAMIETLNGKREELDKLKDKQKSTILKLQSSQNTLKSKEAAKNKLVNELEAKGSELEEVLREKERLAQKLDEELDRQIAEEERKAAERARIAEEKRRKEEERRLAEERRIAEEKRKKEEEERRIAELKEREEREAEAQKIKPEKRRHKPEPPKKEETKVKPPKKHQGYIMDEREEKLAGSFEDNKGRLKSPVSAPYKIVKPFGRHRHPELRHVETNNGGIDVETTAGADACAVFRGKVSVVFKTDGFNIAVMVRHGNYLTVYVNLKNTYVRAGEEVEAGQPLGRVFSDPDDDNRTILHFEIRKEKEKLNPASWIR